MATLDDILNLGNIPLTDLVTDRLPPTVEATLPVAIGKGVPNGVAATNADGVPVDVSGNPMARVGTTAGTAADAAAVTTALGLKLDKSGGTVTGVLAVPTATVGTATTQAASTAFVAGAVATATALPGTIVERRYANGAWPLRGTLPAGIIVSWVGPSFPPFGNGYAVYSVDRYEATA